MSLPFLRTLQGDRFFQLLILVGIGLSFFVPFAPKSWPAAIDWHTIITLSGLMLLTKGVELSGYFDVLGRKMVRRFATERRLAMFMVLAAALLSTFLTNDVALFIVVPLSTTEAQFEGQEIVPITLTKSVQTVTGQPDVDQVVLDEAIKNRSGMPVRLN